MEYNLFMAIAPISFGIVLFVIISMMRFLKGSLAYTLFFYLISTEGLVSLNIIELLSRSPEGTFLFAKLQYTFLCAIPFFWLSFTYIYVDVSKKIVNKRTLPTLLISIIFNIIVHTNDYHHLFWKDLFFPEISGYITMRSTHGPLFWMFGVFLYTVLIYGALLITRKTLRNHSLFVAQRNLLIHGAIFPLLFNILYVSNLLPFLRKDFTPVSFASAGLFFFFGIYWKRFLQIVPIARNIIVQEMDTPIMVMDKNKKIIDFNSASRDLFRLSDDSLGKSIFKQSAIIEFVPKDDLAILEGHTGYFSCSYGGKNYDLRLNPLYQDKSVFIGYLLTVMDVTQYVTVLGEKTKLISQLEQANETLKKTQRQLVQNEKLASIGQLAAGVAHEINNPTGFVLCNLNTLEEYVDVFKDLFKLYEKLLIDKSVTAGQRQELLSRIERIKEEEDIDSILEDVDILLTESRDGAKRIGEIVQNLRDFARSDQDGYADNDLNECIEQAIRISWNQLKYKCEIEKKLSVLPVMFFHKNKIEQVIINLLVNAADAIEDHGKISIETRLEGKNVRIMITDTGKGIPRENQTRIFDPFFTTKEVGKGTGLGMYISHQIINDHGGNIEVESEVGKGTTMNIILPIQGKIRT